MTKNPKQSQDSHTAANSPDKPKLRKGRVGHPELSEAQRATLLGWIAEGLTRQEINDLAVSEGFPIEISAQLLYSYRQNYKLDLNNLRDRWEQEVITTGLALRANRVKALMKLAIELEEDLFQKKLKWTVEVKGIGAGDNYEKISFEQFNEAEIRQLRGVYDDIAKETGGRITRADLTSGDKPLPRSGFDIKQLRNFTEDELAILERAAEILERRDTDSSPAVKD